MTERDALQELNLDMPLDEGIAPFVNVLRRERIETYESCEGGPGHCFREPTIRFHGGPSEGFRAYAAASALGLPILAVRRVWDVVDGELTGPTWEIVFRRSARSDES